MIAAPVINKAAALEEIRRGVAFLEYKNIVLIKKAGGRPAEGRQK